MDKTKIIEYLRSGTALTPVEEDLVQQEVTSLMGLETEIGRLEGEVARLNEQLTFLKAKQQQKDSHSALLVALHAPVRRLSPDVLREIFIHCLPQQITGPPSCRDPPLLLGQVCCLWRRVSIHTPALWSNLPVLWERRYEFEPRNNTKNTNLKKGHTKPGVSLAALWLARSSNLPLTVSIHVNVLDDIKTLLLSCSHRFISLDIDLSRASWLLKTCDLFPYYRLKEISFAITDVSTYSIDLRLGAPNLESAKFHVKTFMEPPARIGVILCWERLSHLSLRRVTAHDTCIVLSKCHNLIDMVLLDIGSDDELESLRPAPIVLPKLRSLRYTGLTYLDYLALPNLQMFSCTYDSRGWPKNSFFSLISRSSCDIRCFRFETEDEEVPEEEQIELLQSLPHLQTFTIIDDRVLEHKEKAISPRAADLVAGRGGSGQEHYHPESFA